MAQIRKIQEDSSVQILHTLAMKNRMEEVYTLIEQFLGSNNCQFTYKLTYGDLISTGTGSSKKNAKHIAAQAMLDKLSKLEMNNQNQGSGSSQDDKSITMHAIGLLETICRKLGWTAPVYEVIEESGPPHLKRFTYQCSVHTCVTKSTDQKKRVARSEAAMKMLKIIAQNNPEIEKFLKNWRKFVSPKIESTQRSSSEEISMKTKLENYSQENWEDDVGNYSKNNFQSKDYSKSDETHTKFNKGITFIPKSICSRLHLTVVKQKLDRFLGILGRMDQSHYTNTSEKIDLEKEFKDIMKQLNIEFEQFVQKTKDGKSITIIYFMIDLPTVHTAIDYDVEHSKIAAYYYTASSLLALIDIDSSSAKK